MPRKMQYKSRDQMNCLICDKIYCQVSRLAHHEVDCHGILIGRWARKNYMAWNSRCDKCGLHFRYSELIPYHNCDDVLKLNENANINSSGQICEKCGAHFHLEHDFKNHIEICPNANRSITGKFQCSFCGKTFNRDSNLSIHLRAMHFGKRDFACVKCDKSFAARRKLEDHYATHHVGRPRFQCETCGKKFFNLSACRKHYKISHAKKYAQILASSGVMALPINELYSVNGCVVLDGENGNDSKDLCCAICNRTFTSIGRFEQHMVVHKKQLIGTFTCTKCDNIYDTKNDLEDHYVCDHLGVIRYTCEFCGHGFSWREPYFRHRKEQHLTEYKGMVGQSNTLAINYNKLNLGNDLDIILTNDTVCERSCVLCIKIFPTEMQLDLHMQSFHLTPEKFNCQRCSKKFITESHLELHLAEMHMGKPWFRCESCNDIFDSKKKYCWHYKMKHPDEYVELLQQESCNQLYEIDGYAIVERVSLENELSTLRTRGEQNAVTIKQEPSTEKQMDQRNEWKSDEEQNAVTIKQEPSTEIYIDHSFNKCGTVDVKNIESKNDTHRCKFCRKTFKQKTELFNHVKDKHKARKHKCDTCEKSYKVPRHLLEHKFSVHYKTPLYRCTLCGKTFFTNGPSFAHRRECHAEELKRAQKPLASYAFIERLNKRD
ncbi:zinc finger protein 595-like isoform X1 [Uranotaenia lowii]|uniref:zinc finger protein 595-like isoform X1 n=1 Tax=Uranotaenia lowii TaxID=190385 RepID=UPI0024792AD3|nr:zinc finger protein 595-like isoform X1 [Uranotaenia lowii]XP_055586036.1 zinc finger protein 595-like isoform X1 [Uranotaenia lowii]